MALPLLSFPAAAQPSEIPTPAPATIVSMSFVPAEVMPNYDKEVLEPLHAAQAKEAAAEQQAAQVATEARLVEETAEAAKVASEVTVAQPSQARTFVAGNDYTAGQCTAYVASRISVPGDMGNATNWESGLLSAGWHYTDAVTGAIGVSHNGGTGHVVIVESVGLVTMISEMNGILGPFNVDTRPALPGEFVYLTK